MWNKPKIIVKFMENQIFWRDLEVVALTQNIVQLIPETLKVFQKVWELVGILKTRNVSMALKFLLKSSLKAQKRCLGTPYLV